MNLKLHSQFPFISFIKESKLQDKKDPNFTTKKVSGKLIQKNLSYNASDDENLFNVSEYDLNNCAMVYDADTYVRRAVDRMVDLMLKNGWEWIGDNPRAVAYIKERYDQIAQVTDIAHDELVESAATNIVLYSNTFMHKARNDRASGGHRYKTIFGFERIPIAGLYVLDSPNITIAKKKNGTPLKYKLSIESDIVYYMPRDIQHFAFARKPGLSFGTPLLVPAIGDVEALRKMEENVEILVFHHSIPLFEYIIGDEENPPEDWEIDNAIQDIENKPVHGIFVHGGRNKLDVIGAEGSAIDVMPYLNHFSRRIFAAFAQSSTSFGEGGSTSRNVAQVQEIQLQDAVKRLQKCLKRGFDAITRELLAEGGYSYDKYDEFNKVEMFIPEIDISAQTLKENHEVDKFLKNATTHSELRKQIGRDPMTPDEIKQTRYFMFPTKADVGAYDESTGENGDKSITTKVRPQNQFGKLGVKPAIPLRTALDDLGINILTDSIANIYVGTYDDVSSLISDMKARHTGHFGDRSKHDLEQIMELSRGMMEDYMKKYSSSAYRIGLQSIPGVISDDKSIDSYNSMNINMLLDDLSDMIIENEDDIFKEKSLMLDHIFDSMRFKIKYLSRMGMAKAYNLGVVRYILSTGEDVVSINHISHTGDTVELKINDNMTLDQIPPFDSDHMCELTERNGNRRKDA